MAKKHGISSNNHYTKSNFKFPYFSLFFKSILYQTVIYPPTPIQSKIPCYYISLLHAHKKQINIQKKMGALNITNGKVLSTQFIKQKKIISNKTNLLINIRQSFDHCYRNVNKDYSVCVGTLLLWTSKCYCCCFVFFW